MDNCPWTDDIHGQLSTKRTRPYYLDTEKVNKFVFKNFFHLDTCCGSRPYYKEKQACCESYLVGIEIYTVADGCCYGEIFLQRSLIFKRHT
jgi:hypothetical protein